MTDDVDEELVDRQRLHEARHHVTDLASWKPPPVCSWRLGRIDAVRILSTSGYSPEAPVRSRQRTTTTSLYCMTVATALQTM